MKVRSIYAYVLAGGQSRRMGRDKLGLKLGSKTLLERTISVCEKVFDTVIILSGSARKFNDYEYEVVPDDEKSKGPMAGIIAALKDCPGDFCFITAADLYDLSPAIIRVLLANYNGEQFAGLEEKGSVQPLCGLYSKSALKILSELSSKGSYKMKDAVKALEHKLIPVEMPHWRNLNRPEDLRIKS